jgi:exonuclease VII small subunit
MSIGIEEKNKESYEKIMDSFTENVKSLENGRKSYKDAMMFHFIQLELKCASCTKNKRKVKLNYNAKLDSLDDQVRRLGPDGVSDFQISYSLTDINDRELEALAHILAGIEIVKFDLSYCRKLTSVACLRNLKIKNLILTGSTNITDISSLSDITLIL